MPRSISPEKRNTYMALLEKLWQKGEIDADVAARELGLSIVEARRCIDLLASKLQWRWIERIPGTSRLILRGRSTFFRALGTRSTEKRKIAARVVGNYVRPGDTLALGSGSTAAFIAMELVRQSADVHILTNNAFAFSYLHGMSDSPLEHNRIECTGGRYHLDRNFFYGPSALAAFRKRAVTTAIVSLNGITAEGELLLASALEAEIDRELMRLADGKRRVVVAMDSAKIKVPRGLEVVHVLGDIPARDKGRYVLATTKPDDASAEAEALDYYRRHVIVDCVT